MSADHRKPVVAFVVLAFLAAAFVGLQRADAQSGRYLPSLFVASDRVEGSFPDIGTSVRQIRPAGQALGQGFAVAARRAEMDATAVAVEAAPSPTRAADRSAKHQRSAGVVGSRPTGSATTGAGKAVRHAFARPRSVTADLPRHAEQARKARHSSPRGHHRHHAHLGPSWPERRAHAARKAHGAEHHGWSGHRARSHAGARPGLRHAPARARPLPARRPRG